MPTSACTGCVKLYDTTPNSITTRCRYGALLYVLVRLNCFPFNTGITHGGCNVPLQVRTYNVLSMLLFALRS